MKFEQLTRFARGFVYAYNGIRAAIREERNFRFHLCAALYAFVAAYWAQLPAVETALIALCVAAVLALTMWRTGALTFVTDHSRDLQALLPAVQVTLPEKQPPKLLPEKLGRPVDSRPGENFYTRVSSALESLLNAAENIK